MTLAFPADLAARYAPQELLGEGGFGGVWRAVDRELGRAVAVKLLHRTIESPETVARFEREARVTSRLEHPGVVRIFDAGVCADGTPFIVYEHVEGRDLARRLEVDGPAPARQVAEWGALLADALALAHREGILHRDVKPRNVLLRLDRDPVLCDFGIARVAGSATVRTAEGLVLGTPATMAPEVILGEEPGAAADQFSLGATLFEAWTGRPVYGSQELSAVLEALRTDRSPRVPEELRARAPALASALERSLARRPGERFADLEEFAATLRRAVADPTPEPRPGPEGHPAPARTRILRPLREEPAPTPARRAPSAPTGRRPTRWIALAVLAGVALLIGLLGPPPTTDQAPAPPEATALPVADPGAEATARLAECLDRLDALHDTSVPLVERDHHTTHVMATRAELLDPRFREAFDQATTAAPPWLRRLQETATGTSPLDRGPPYLLLLRFLDTLNHGFGDVKHLKAHQAIQGVTAGRSPLAMARDLAATHEQQIALGQSIHAFLAATEDLPGPPSAMLAYASHVLGLQLDERPHERMFRDLERSLEVDDLVHLEHTTIAYALTLESATHESRLRPGDCEELTRRYRLLLDLIRERAAPRAAESATFATWRALAVAVRLREHCPGSAPPFQELFRLDPRLLFRSRDRRSAAAPRTVPVVGRWVRHDAETRRIPIERIDPILRAGLESLGPVALEAAGLETVAPGTSQDPGPPAPDLTRSGP